MTKKSTGAAESPPTIEEELLPDVQGQSEGETLPTTQGERHLASVPDRPGGMEAFDADDIVIPKMRIVQPTSEEGTPGTFRLNLTEEEFHALDVVFIKATKGRVLFSKDLTEGAVCGSNDRIHPHPYFENPMAEACAECMYGKWEGRTPPECNESYTLLALDIETLMPFFIQTKGTGVRPTKMFLSAVFLKAKQKKADLWDFRVTLMLKEVKNDRGKFYVPVFKQPTYVDGHPFRDEAALYMHEEAGFDNKPGEASAAEPTGGEAF